MVGVGNPAQAELGRGTRHPVFLTLRTKYWIYGVGGATSRRTTS